MCGIVGYTGHRPALDVVLDGLRRLEYRGYDSAGGDEPGHFPSSLVSATQRVTLV